MATLRERIEAAQKRAEEAAAKVEELKKKEAAGPKRQASRDITQVREIILLEGQLRKKYGCGYSGLAEIARKAKKDGIEPVTATGQKVEDHPADDVTMEPPPVPPLPHQEPEELAPQSDESGLEEPSGSGLGEPEFDENDEPPVPNTPELVAAQEDDEVPW